MINAAFILGIIIITLVALYMVNRLIHPVLKLSSFVKNITQTKDYSKSVDIQTNDEIGKLAKAFNNMLLGIYTALKENEKWDGSGYPRGLKGEEIHIYGRITALADVFDALGSDRVYKKAWEDKRIFALFKEERGKHFDPKLVDIFFEHLDDFLKIRDKFKDN